MHIVYKAEINAIPLLARGSATAVHADRARGERRCAARSGRPVDPIGNSFLIFPKARGARRPTRRSKGG
jgi:hypothetical protein